MRFSELSPQALEKLRAYEYDRIVEKHEGPFRWEAKLRYDELEFLQAEGYDLLLPIGREQHPNITILRCIVSRDNQIITLFLKDTTFTDDPKGNGSLPVFWLSARKCQERNSIWQRSITNGLSQKIR
jgi:hypothetical protein